jgi:hypothetical protein
MTKEQAEQCVKYFAYCEEQGGVGRSGPHGGEVADIPESTMTMDEMMQWKCWELVVTVLAQGRFYESFRRYLKRWCLNAETPETYKPAVFGFYAPKSRRDSALMVHIWFDDFWPQLMDKPYPVLHAPFASVE